MFSNQLLDEMGLLNLKHKQTQQTAVKPISPDTENKSAVIKSEAKKTLASVVEKQAKEQPKLDKNEFRLLVKMLQAIGHECVYDDILYDGHFVTYKLPNLNLLFKDINLADDATTMNLSSLADIISKPELKRPVWEKLKTLQS